MAQITSLSKPDCIRTYSGHEVNVFKPDPNTLDIIDIAHSLSKQCRFGSHLEQSYSVAQHSVLCSLFVEEKYKYAALMHDISEAYIVDVPRPIKHRLKEYKKIEHNFMLVAAKKFEFDWPMPKAVEVMDDVLLRLEWDELMIKKSDYGIFKPLTWQEAKQLFLQHYHILSEQLPF